MEKGVFSFTLPSHKPYLCMDLDFSNLVLNIFDFCIFSYATTFFFYNKIENIYIFLCANQNSNEFILLAKTLKENNLLMFKIKTQAMFKTLQQILYKLHVPKLKKNDQ
jgi:hypothetical protein